MAEPGVPLPLLMVLFPAGFVLAVLGLTVHLAAGRGRAGARRNLVARWAGAAAAVGAAVFAVGGSYPGTGPALVLGRLAAVAVAVLALAPLVPAARRLSPRTRRNAPVAALAVTVLDLHLLLDQPPADGQAVTVLLMAASTAFLLRPSPPLPRRRQRLAVAGLVLTLTATAFTWRTIDSRHPGSFSLMAGRTRVSGMAGVMSGGMAGMHGGRPLTALVAPAVPRGLVHRYLLTARQDGDRLRFEPGELQFVQGERAEITLRNELRESTSVHWHGMVVPNSQDGVSGLTQDAVPPGGTRVYSFDVRDAGTYWFHAHQSSSDQVPRGLYGAVVVASAAGASGAGVDRAVLLQVVRDRVVLADAAGGRGVTADPGTRVRLRVVNTDETAHSVTLRGAAFTVVALDGHDLHGATPLTDTSVLVPAGGRADLGYLQPAGHAAVLQSTDDAGATYRTGAAAAADPAASSPLTTFDADRYGIRAPDDIRDATRFDLDATVRLTTKFGFYDGAFGMYTFIDDRLYPDGRMLMVHEGALVRVRLENRSYLVHPMHLHGHTMTVLEHDGRPVSGSTLRLDTLQMQPGETYTVAFRADNPGLWMFHCHNLTHAAAGMDLMLGYDGVTTPFRAGPDTGNQPE